MPELPEVQTIVSDLHEKIATKTITGIKIIDPINIKNVSSEQFTDQLLCNTVIDVIRRGKMIDVQLSGNLHLLFHLKMTGNFSYYENKEELHKHSKLIITFNDESKLVFSDIRKFAVILLVESDFLRKIPYIAKMGLEPFSKEYTLENFEIKVKRYKNRNIKNFLLDQHIVVGIGNIYASEILFDTKIDPNREVSSLKRKEINNLFSSIKTILGEAIKVRGTTFSDYKDLSGNLGSFQNNLKVYKRDSQKCFNCNNIILKIKQNGRSTFYCRKCQK